MEAPSKEFALAGSLEELKLKGRLVVHGCPCRKFDPVAG